MKKTLFSIIRDAFIITAIAILVAGSVNLIREDALEWIASKPYDIFVPCPETLGKVETISPQHEFITDGRSFLIDARSQDDFNAWHPNEALNLVYDYLDPVPEDVMQYMSENIIQSGKARVIIYGDGDGLKGSSGYELGRELSGRGVKNIYVIEGGFQALKEALHDK